MDYVTRQFIFLAKKFRKELHKAQSSLHRDLMRISDGLKNLKETISTQGKSDKETNQTQPSVSISDFRTNVPIPVQNKTEKTIAEWGWTIFKGALEIFGIFAGIALVYLAFQSWQESIEATNFAARSAELSRKGLNETVKNFKIDERPYVIVSDVIFDGPLESDKEIGLSVIADNSGHTPAVKVKFSGAAYIDGKMIGGKFINLKANSVIPPQHPSKAHFTVTFSALDVEHVASSEAFKIQGTIQYTDIFNDTHSTTYCAVYDGKHKLFVFCQSGNDVK